MIHLADAIVRSTIHLLLIDPKTKIPYSTGSGCIINYQKNDFLISVEHVTNERGYATCIELGLPPQGNYSPVYSVGAMNYVATKIIKTDEDIEKVINSLDNVDELQKMDHLDITFLKLEKDIEIHQNELNFGNFIIAPGLKQKIITDLTTAPNKNKEFGFYGKIKANFQGVHLTSEPKLILGLKYIEKVDRFLKFQLHNTILDEDEYCGTSGAPVIDSDGNLVGFIAHGLLNEPYIYAFSIDTLKMILDLELRD